MSWGRCVNRPVGFFRCLPLPLAHVKPENSNTKSLGARRCIPPYLLQHESCKFVRTRIVTYGRFTVIASKYEV